MVNLVKDRIEAILQCCVKYYVKRLEIFGSAAEDSADDSKIGDVDFLVEFTSSSPVEHCTSYFGLHEELETILNMHVDLVEIKAMRNPYFIRRANESRKLIYAA
ncbi:MAG: nucleotidyltransferase domain-containing protein [Magnetococcales bacterium]|nr:nucleotidyltransferase domain-containing protein [Nitrospirota bacterium]